MASWPKLDEVYVRGSLVLAWQAWKVVSLKFAFENKASDIMVSYYLISEAIQ